MTTTVQRVQIERTILRTGGIPNAHFRLTDGTFLCQASLWPDDDEDGRVQIVSRGGALNAEQAGQVAIALNMAIEWVAEETCVGRPQSADVKTDGGVAK